MHERNTQSTVRGGGTSFGFPRISRGQFLQVVLAMAALTALHFRRVLFFGETYCTTIDMYNQHYPLTLGAVRAWLAGEFPLWCPWVGSGTPWFAATTPNLFDPFAFWLYLLPNDTGIGLQFMSQCFAAGCAYYVSFRYWRASHRTALALAVLGVWTANFLDAMPWRVLSGGHWSIPLALVAFDMALSGRRTVPAVLAAAVLLACTLFATQPQIWVYAVLFVVVYGGGWWWKRRTRAAMLRVCLVGTAIASLWFMLTAAQVLPFVEFFRLSNRAAPVPGAQAAPWADPDAPGPVAGMGHTVETVRADLREMRRALAWDGQFRLSQGYRTLRAYTGISPGLTLLTVIGVTWSRRRVPTWFALGMIALALAGFSTPLGNWLVRWISGIQLQRLQLFLPWLFGLAAAGGLEALQSGRSRRSWRTIWLPLCLGAAILVPWVRSLQDTLPTLQRLGVADKFGASYFVRITAELGFFAFVLARACAVRGLTAVRFRRVLPIIVGAVAAAHAIYSGPAAIRTSPQAATQELWPGLMSAVTPERLALLIMQRDPRYYGPDLEANLYHLPMPPNHATLYSPPFAVVADYNNLLVESYVEYMDMLNLGERSQGWYSMVGLANPGHPLVDLLGVRYLAGWADARRAPGGAKYRLVHHDPAFRYRGHQDFDVAWPLFVLENTQTLPRAFFISRAVTMPNAADRLRTLADPAFDARRGVILNTAPLSPATVQPALSADRDPHFTAATVTEYRVNDLRVHVSAPTDGFLVLTDVAFPGWVATVDGQPVDILTAYHTFRAVPIAAGPHAVQFAYRPRSFAIGMCLSILGWVGTISGFGVWAAWRRRRSTGAAQA